MSAIGFWEKIFDFQIFNGVGNEIKMAILERSVLFSSNDES